jgi:hypothetical protein
MNNKNDGENEKQPRFQPSLRALIVITLCCALIVRMYMFNIWLGYLMTATLILMLGIIYSKMKETFLFVFIVVFIGALLSPIKSEVPRRPKVPKSRVQLPIHDPKASP